MPFNKKTEFKPMLGILESEVGLVTKTRQFDASTLTAEGDGRKYLYAGTLISETGKPLGVVLQDHDLTDEGKYPIAVVEQGRLRADRVSSDVKAKKSDLAAQGLYLI